MRDRRHFPLFELDGDAFDDDAVLDIRINNDVRGLTEQFLFVPGIIK
jgi:hypothetical protein